MSVVESPTSRNPAGDGDGSRIALLNETRIGFQHAVAGTARAATRSVKLVVPALIIAGCLVLIQPKLSAWVADRGQDRPDQIGPSLIAGVFLTRVYGGYFGAAHARRAARRLPDRQPAASQRWQERTRHDRERHGDGDLRSHRLARRGADRHPP